MDFSQVKSWTIPEGQVKKAWINGQLVWQAPNPLPYDARVEYVESTGAQWVDTGINAFDWPYLEITCKVNGTYNNGSRFGMIGNSDRLNHWQGIAPKGTEGVYFRGYDVNITTISESATNDFITLIFDGPNRMAYAGQSSASLLGSGQKAGSRYGICAYIGNVSPIAMSIASVKIGTSGANLLFDAIPVRVGNTGYLYDRVNPAGGPSGNGLHGSATSTPLIAGPDINA